MKRGRVEGERQRRRQIRKIPTEIKNKKQENNDSRKVLYGKRIRYERKECKR
jgi:hypothetical protein